MPEAMKRSCEALVAMLDHPPSATWTTAQAPAWTTEMTTTVRPVCIYRLAGDLGVTLGAPLLPYLSICGSGCTCRS